jgi:hypothetical protein
LLSGASFILEHPPLFEALIRRISQVVNAATEERYGVARVPE